MDELDLHLIERIEAKFAALTAALARAEAERDRMQAERDRLRDELESLRRPVAASGPVAASEPVVLAGTSLDDDDWARLIDAG